MGGSAVCLFRLSGRCGSGRSPKAKDDIPSNGAPEITKIVLANDKEFEIDGADFEDMVRIEGKNLGNVVSVKFNDVEVDPKEIYARYDMLLAPVPRQLPGEVTDMLYITTKNGSVSRPFTVSIPELKIDGLQNEFTNPGDTTVIRAITSTFTVLPSNRPMCA